MHSWISFQYNQYMKERLNGKRVEKKIRIVSLNNLWKWKFINFIQIFSIVVGTKMKKNEICILDIFEQSYQLVFIFIQIFCFRCSANNKNNDKQKTLANGWPLCMWFVCLIGIFMYMDMWMSPIKRG